VKHLMVTFMVTEDGEPGHPMDTFATRIDLDDLGNPLPGPWTRLHERVKRELRRKVAARRAPDPDPERAS
jgi:hypothetical protein